MALRLGPVDLRLIILNAMRATATQRKHRGASEDKIIAQPYVRLHRLARRMSVGGALRARVMAFILLAHHVCSSSFSSFFPIKDRAEAVVGGMWA
jgi:hypothetical protein